MENLTLTDILNMIDCPNTVSSKNGIIEGKYILGDSEEAAEFTKKSEFISKKYEKLDIQLDILCDDWGEEEAMSEWNIVNINIKYNNISDLSFIKKFLEEINPI